MKPKAKMNPAERLAEIRERGILYREATVGGIDKEARTVELSFSSEAEYERWFGIEVLDHTAGAVRLDRLNDKAALLWNHDWDDQRGVVESARVDADRKGRAVVRFSRSEDGEQLFQDVLDGIVTKVSVGYQIHGIKLAEERENIDVYRVTDWEPYEISLVSVPADASVGVGRAAEKPREETPLQQGQNAGTGEKTPDLIQFGETKTMNEKTLRDSAGNLVRAKVDDAGKIVEVLEVIEPASRAMITHIDAAADSKRVADIAALGKAYNAGEKALEFISSNKTAEDFQRFLLADFATERSKQTLDQQQKGANIGLSENEVRQFSILRAARAMDPKASRADIEAAAFEMEASRAAAKLYGKDPQGIIIPNDVLASRAFGTGANGTSGAGSNAVAQNLMAGSFIELLRKKAWVMRRARSMAGLVGNVDIPRQAGAGQAYWVGEGGSPSGSNPALDQIHFTPKTVGAYTDITRRLMIQATPDAEAIVRDDLLKIMGLEVDRVAIYGSGSSNQPTGLKNISGINAVDFASAGQPSFAELVAMETQIALDDADVDAMSYAFNAAVRGHAKTTLKFPGVNGSSTIWEQGNTVNGYETNVSNQIASGDVFFGNWQDMIIAMWGGLELMVDPYALSTSGGLRIIVLQDVDINIRHKESFCYGSDTVA